LNDSLYLEGVKLLLHTLRGCSGDFLVGGQHLIDREQHVGLPFADFGQVRTGRVWHLGRIAELLVQIKSKMKAGRRKLRITPKEEVNHSFSSLHISPE
jgi:hypothetical protein